MVLDPTSSSRPFGLAICDKCIKYGTTNVPYSHFARFQPGVAFFQWNKVMGPHTDPVTGEFHGPLVKPIELQQIECSYKSMNERKSALEEVVVRAHTKSGKYCPCQYEEKAAVYVEIFESAETEADDYVAAAQEREYEQYRERRDLRLEKRLLRVKAIYATLDNLLDGCPLKDLALDCTWHEKDQDCLKFTCTIVDQTMRNIVSAPASASDKMIYDAATRIREIFTTLHEKKFFTFSFIAESSNRFRQGMYEYCQNEMTPVKIMRSSCADSNFLRYIEINHPTKALIRVFNMIHGALPRCFALSVVRPNMNEDDPENRIDDYRKLAEAVWKKRSSIGPTWSLNTIKESFNSCVEEFRTMKKNAKDYLAADQTHAFLQRDPPPGHRGGGFSRQDALNQVFSPSTILTHLMTVNERHSPYDLLLNRNFQTLRSVHEAYFRNPERYGLHS